MPGDIIEWETYLKFVLSLALVIGLILVAAWTMRRYGLGQMAPLNRGRKRKRRITVVESANLDARRRLLLIRQDDQEHLILIGGGADLVIGQPKAALEPEPEDNSDDMPKMPNSKEAQP